MLFIEKCYVWIPPRRGWPDVLLSFVRPWVWDSWRYLTFCVLESGFIYCKFMQNPKLSTLCDVQLQQQHACFLKRSGIFSLLVTILKSVARRHPPAQAVCVVPGIKYSDCVFFISRVQAICLGRELLFRRWLSGWSRSFRSHQQCQSLFLLASLFFTFHLPIRLLKRCLFPLEQRRTGCSGVILLKSSSTYRGNMFLSKSFLFFTLLNSDEGSCPQVCRVKISRFAGIFSLSLSPSHPASWFFCRCN